ncbi:MAG: hypothetical protein IKX54_00710 [Lachnospiraceae bacterium]|nr:hypothetical protein [Lachnospiraceae bacterium]
MDDKKRALIAFVLAAVFLAAALVFLQIYDTGRRIKNTDWAGYTALLLIGLLSIAFIFGMWFKFRNKKATIVMCAGFGLALFTVALILAEILSPLDLRHTLGLVIMLVLNSFASVICYAVGIAMAIGGRHRKDL